MDTTFGILFAFSGSGTDMLSATTELARKFGPFFFSVLFLTYMVRWAQKKYIDLTSRKDPVPTRQEMLIHASVFLGTFIVGIILVGVSVRWWLHFGQENYIYGGVFKNLHSYEQLDSDEGVGMFFHDETKKPNGPLGRDTDLIHNSHFIVVQPKSFVDCQRFPVNLSKGGLAPLASDGRGGGGEDAGQPVDRRPAGGRESFEIEYRKGDESPPGPAFTIEWDPESLKDVVKRVTPANGPCPGALVATVFADTLNPPQARKKQSKPRSSSVQAMAAQRPDVSADLEILQDTRTSVGSKLQAIQDFAALPQADQDASLSSETVVEPVLITFLDLTRHSDKQLAYHVITALQNFDSDSFVVGLSQSSNPDLRTTAITDIEHMESPQVDRLMEKLKAKPGPVYSAISSTIRDPKNFLRLRPTGSAEGDRYYVRAAWNPNSQSATNCLTNLFNRELISSRSIQQEFVKMQGRSNRLVYWYTKDWAMQIANQVRQCGGSSEYVSP